MEATTQREQIRASIESFTGCSVTDEEIENLARTTPALYYLVSEQAQGRLCDSRTVTDEFLRRLPEPLFDYLLVGALAFFRRGQQMDIETLLSTEFCGIAMRLLVEESDEADAVRERTDEECLTMLDRFSRLILLEEQRRAEAFAWINRYSLLARVTDDYPPRLPQVGRRTEH